jgi:hypothetical protein
MFTRMLIFVLMFTLSLPVTTLTRSAETNHSPWGEVAVAAKSKKHKNKTKKGKPSPGRTVRETVTQIFASTQPITIPNGAPGTTEGTANSYPSEINVSGLTNGTITDVNLLLSDLTHASPTDVDILLSSSDGRQALALSDIESGSRVVDVDLTLDDEAASLPSPVAPTNDLISGAFRPTNHTYVADTFAAPAPALDGNVALSSFDGAEPNGTWQLWVMDNASGDFGDIGGGWALQITAEVDVQVEEPAKAKDKAKKHKRQGKKRR